MKHRTAARAGALLLVVASSAFGATFRAEVEGDTVVVYSTAKKDEACYSMVTFSYKSGDERQTRRFVCNGFARAEKDFRFCSRTDPGFVDLKIEGPVTGTCE
jgi:hypothetical protein